MMGSKLELRTAAAIAVVSSAKFWKLTSRRRTRSPSRSQRTVEVLTFEPP